MLPPLTRHIHMQTEVPRQERPDGGGEAAWTISFRHIMEATAAVEAPRVEPPRSIGSPGNEVFSHVKRDVDEVCPSVTSITANIESSGLDGNSDSHRSKKRRLLNGNVEPIDAVEEGGVETVEAAPYTNTPIWPAGAGRHLRSSCNEPLGPPSSASSFFASRPLALLPLTSVHPKVTSDSINGGSKTYSAGPTLIADLVISSSKNSSAVDHDLVTGHHSCRRTMSESLVTQLCKRAARRALDIAYFEKLAHDPVGSYRLVNTTVVSEDSDQPPSATLGASAVGTRLSGSTPSDSLLPHHARFDLAQFAALHEREKGILTLQQHCFRLLRNVNLCFPAWGAHDGSYLWHASFILDASYYRDVSSYSLIFEDVATEINSRLLDAQHKEVHLRRSLDTRNTRQSVRAVHSSSSSKRGTPAGVPGEGVSTNKEEDDTSTTGQLTNATVFLDDKPVDEKPQTEDCVPVSRVASFVSPVERATLNAADSKVDHGDTSSATTIPLCIANNLLSSLMFQVDSGLMVQCLILLDGLRQHYDAEFQPLPTLQEALASFVAMQAFHAVHQPPVHFLAGIATRFRSAADLSAGASGRGTGRRRAAANAWNNPMALVGTADSLFCGSGTRVTADGKGKTRRQSSRPPEGTASTITGSSTAAAQRTRRLDPPRPLLSSLVAKVESPVGAKDDPVCRPPLQDDQTATVVSLTCPDGPKQPKLEVTTDSDGTHPPQEQESPLAVNVWEESDDDETGQTNLMTRTTRYSGSVDVPESVMSSAMLQVTTDPQVTSNGNSVASAVNHHNKTASPEPRRLSTTPEILGSSQGDTLQPQPDHISPMHKEYHTSLQSSTVAVSNNSSGMDAYESLSVPGVSAQHSPDAVELPRDPEVFRSQVKGVYYDDTSNRWCASWHERKTGKKKSRYFAVKKFGFSTAKAHAMGARLEAEESGDCAPTNIN